MPAAVAADKTAAETRDLISFEQSVDQGFLDGRQHDDVEQDFFHL